jgi:hypothetical protein
MVTFNSIGNCNMVYVSSLNGYGSSEEDMFIALKDIVKRNNRFNPSPFAKKVKTAAKYSRPNEAIYIFAQGSEHPVGTRPYAHTLMTLIHRYKLGKVVATGPAKNALHGNKPGYGFLWQLDKDAMAKFYDKYIVKGTRYVRAKKKESPPPV